MRILYPEALKTMVRFIEGTPKVQTSDVVTSTFHHIRKLDFIRYNGELEIQGRSLRLELHSAQPPEEERATVNKPKAEQRSCTNNPPELRINSTDFIDLTVSETQDSRQ